MPNIKPTAVNKLSGAYDHDPQRARARGNEPEPEEGLGIAPSYLTKDEQKVWRETKRVASWLTSADQYALESLCHLVAKMRTDKMTAAEYGLLRGVLGSLGLTPVDRTRIQVAKTEKKTVDEWSILQRPGASLRPNSDKRKDAGLPPSSPSVQ